ncbi:DUF2953 domain-containing protein [Metabacillus sp. GX 13764]|uniref:DUF2953 domain-containing protein n=1 Tax=Metabacillus kandeliae TaxID=2900151 RepID=UPI001E4457A7|nr:DUF2953 domain-containing protein [Metabacillus kandeliae]MCD7032762.1 DUF2953 domain-containing protein [Metabacillus kandeliae]
MIWLFLSAIILLFLAMILATKITVILHLKREGKNDRLTVKFKAWYGLLRYTVDIPGAKWNEKDGSLDIKKEKNAGNSESGGSSSEEKISSHDVLAGIKDVRELTEHVVKLHSIARKFLKKVRVARLEWISEIGTGDAASTGFAAGAGWSIKFTVFAVIDQYFSVTEAPCFHIQPNFQKACANTYLQGIFHFRIGNAILAGIRFVKYWKGGKPAFLNKPLSSIFSSKNKTA